MASRIDSPRGRALALTAMLGVALLPALAHAGYPTYPPTPAPAAGPVQTNLVSDIAGQGMRTDANLVNPWGIATAADGTLWIAANGTGVALAVRDNGQPVMTAANPLLLTVPAPPAGTNAAAPTGLVVNDSTGFALQPNKPAQLLFATEDGTISGWSPDVDMTHAMLEVNHSPAAVYKGLALLGNQLFAANFRGNSVDVFNSDFSAAGSFTDATVPAGFAPFGIQNLGGTLYVTFAKQDAAKHDDVRGAGNGFVDILDPATHKFTRLISGLKPSGAVNAPLNSPWGLALAPAGFDPVSNQLLVGNFGDGWINAFDPHTGAFVSSLKQSSGQTVVIDGLWGLAFGTDPNDKTHPHLFFTAGIDGEQHGLFGSLSATGA